MLTDILLTTDVSAVSDSVTYLAQNGGGSMTLDSTGIESPEINIVWPESVIQIARVVAVLAALGWAIFAFSKFLNPGSQGSFVQKIGGIMPLLGAAVAVVIFWDLNNTTRIINILFRVGTTLWAWLTSGMAADNV